MTVVLRFLNLLTLIYYLQSAKIVTIVKKPPIIGGFLFAAFLLIR